MNSKPLVSILMTAYNREKFIAAAVESVLASTYSNFELIIVDDGSKDNTVAIARSYEAKDKRVKVFINETNLGDYPNRNRAASLATGEYLKYLDSDDLIYSYGLEAFIGFMERDKDVALGVSYRKNITHQPFPEILDPTRSLRHHFFTEGFLDCAPTGTIIRRSYFEAVGGFSGKRMIGDLEFGLKIARSYKVMILPPALAFWRNHGDQEVFIGIDNNMYASMIADVLKEQFADLPAEIMSDEEKSKVLKYFVRLKKVSGGKAYLKKLLFPKK
ncbi:MAG TPA: glycosyltransferase family 2 protein [Puia sp.]|nr:glycosyltransferase family 2 protein [Puia sp.]